MLATNDEVQAALTSFGAIFIKLGARPTPRLVRTSSPKTHVLAQDPSPRSPCAGPLALGDDPAPLRPGAVRTRLVALAGAARHDYDHIADATVTSAAVHRPPERPARRN
jgi:hypothetical protein